MNEASLKSPFNKSRLLFYFIVLIAICLRIKHEIYFPVVESDYGVLIEAAKNFLYGKGFTNSSVSLSDLGSVGYNNLTMWPVGYSILLVPVYLICENWFIACIFWQSLGALFLIYSMYKILKLFGVEKKMLAVFLLFMAFTPTPFYYLGTTDILTADIFLWCTYIILKCSVKNIFKWKHFLLVGVLSAFNCTLRFASIPNLVIFPLFFLLIGFLRKEKRLYGGAFFTLTLSLLLVLLFFSFFKINSARTNFMQNIYHFDFYFNHMKWFDSFPVKSFFYARPLEFRIPAGHPGLIMLYRIGMHVVSVFFLFLLAYQFIFKERINNYFRSAIPGKRIISYYFLILLIAFIIVVGFISLQSLTVPPEGNSFGPAWMPHLWTHVYSSRYFILLMILLQLAFFLMLSKLSFLSEKIVGVISYSFFTVSFLYAIGFWLLTNYQMYAPGGNGGGSYWRNYADHIDYFNEINQISNKENKKVVFASYDLGKNYPAVVYSQGFVCRDYQGLIKSQLNHTSPLCLLIEMPYASSEDEKVFLKKYSPALLLKFKESLLYRIDLK